MSVIDRENVCVWWCGRESGGDDRGSDTVSVGHRDESMEPCVPVRSAKRQFSLSLSVWVWLVMKMCCWYSYPLVAPKIVRIFIW